MITIFNFYVNFFFLTFYHFSSSSPTIGSFLFFLCASLGIPIAVLQQKLVADSLAHVVAVDPDLCGRHVIWKHDLAVGWMSAIPQLLEEVNGDSGSGRDCAACLTSEPQQDVVVVLHRHVDVLTLIIA